MGDGGVGAAFRSDSSIPHTYLTCPGHEVVTCPKFESRPRFPSQKLLVGVESLQPLSQPWMFRKMAGFAQSSYTVRVHQRRRPFSRVFWPRASPESQPLFSPPTSSNVFPLCLSCEGVPFGVCSQEKPRSRWETPDARRVQFASPPKTAIADQILIQMCRSGAKFERGISGIPGIPRKRLKTRREKKWPRRSRGCRDL